MKSLEILQSDTVIRRYEQVSEYNMKFRSMINNYYRPDRFRDLHLGHESSIVVEGAHLSEGEDKENIRATFPSLLSRSSITLSKKVES